MVKTCEALVMDDGYLSIAEDVRHEMDLRRGERVEITIRRFSTDEPMDADNPLMKMIGLCGEIGKTDLSVNHDHYLYREDNP
jgi:hypothetical protein